MHVTQLLCILATLVAELKTESTSTACSGNAKLPTEEVLKDLYNQWLTEDDGIHKVFFNWSPLYQEQVYRLKSVGRLAAFKKLVFALDGETKCRKHLQRTSSDLRHNSLCPWYIVLTVAADRYPKNMTEAVCKCRNCYKTNGVRRGKKKRIGGPICKEIKQMFKVLKVMRNPDETPVCLNNSDVYSVQKAYQEVTIGCACSFEIITRSTKMVTQG